VSVWEFFWPLLAGARLVLARPDGQRDSAYLCQVLEQQAISTVHFVPSLLQVLLLDPALPSFPHLRSVLCSGEALSFDLQQRFFARLTARLFNLYGPTEAAVDVSCWSCDPASAPPVPIGFPIANIQLLVLDPFLRLVPQGVSGELFIAGIGLARGYWRRPSLTAERFLPHPYSTLPGERLYRTGDLARQRSDGSIEFLGRTDFQLKIRGQRIEPGEIEAVLRRLPGIQDAVVLAQSGQSGQDRLLAYVLPHPADLAGTASIARQ